MATNLNQYRSRALGSGCVDFDVRQEIKKAMQTDLQELIPESQRDLVEAVPKGFFKSAIVGGMLLGSILGAIACMFVSSWMVPAVLAALLVAQRIWIWRSDKGYDRRITELEARGLSGSLNVRPSDLQRRTSRRW